MEDQLRQVVEHLQNKVSIADVLIKLGFREVQTGMGDREQQIPCPLHGDGNDNTYSGRIYPDSNTYHCFACGSTRDIIQSIRDAKDVTFWQAVRWVEATWNLPAFKADFVQQEGIKSRVKKGFAKAEDYEPMRDKVLHQLEMVTRNRRFDMLTTLKLWKVYDMVVWTVEQERCSKQAGVRSLQQVQEKLVSLFGERPA